ncbi:MAG: hypothetical protein KG003_07615 [Bacteroidetes bacterium]|nr:hypothetical protein [Bacteroidota bacterium]
MQDNQVLYTLRNIPPWLPVLFLIVLFVILYIIYKDPFFKDIISGTLIVAFLTSIGIKLAPTQSPKLDTQSGDININPIPKNPATESSPESKPLNDLSEEEIRNLHHGLENLEDKGNESGTE